MVGVATAQVGNTGVGREGRTYTDKRQYPSVDSKTPAVWVVVVERVGFVGGKKFREKPEGEEQAGIKPLAFLGERKKNLVATCQKGK